MVTTVDEPEDPTPDQEVGIPEPDQDQDGEVADQEPVENFRRGLAGPPTPEEVAGIVQDIDPGPAEPPDPTQPIGRRRRPRREENQTVTTDEQPAVTPGRPRRQRGGVSKDEQISFAEESIDVEEDAGLMLLAALDVRDGNREAASAFKKADRDIKEDLKRRGFYDGKPHELRVDCYLLTIAPSDGEAKAISFERQPPIRVTIQRQGE